MMYAHTDISLLSCFLCCPLNTHYDHYLPSGRWILVCPPINRLIMELAQAKSETTPWYLGHTLWTIIDQLLGEHTRVPIDL